MPRPCAATNGRCGTIRRRRRLFGRSFPWRCELNRYAEAVRYALKARGVGRDAIRSLFRRLGVYLTQEGDWARAVALYEKALAARATRQGDGRRHRPAHGTGPALPVDREVQTGGGMFRPRDLCPGPPRRIAIEEQAKRMLLGEPGPTYQLMGECFLVGRSAARRRWPPFRRPTKLAPDKALQQFNLARVDAKTGKPAEALAALEASFRRAPDRRRHRPYETLAEVLGQPRQKGRT